MLQVIRVQPLSVRTLDPDQNVPGRQIVGAGKGRGLEAMLAKEFDGGRHRRVANKDLPCSGYGSH